MGAGAPAAVGPRLGRHQRYRQDALYYTFSRLDWFKSRRASALRSFLRQVVENRIRDELLRVTRRRRVIAPEQPVRASEDGAPQLKALIDDDDWRHYLDGLKRLRPRDQRLIVGRVEFGYNYQQLALVERLPSADAARKALRRALSRLSDTIPHPPRPRPARVPGAAIDALDPGAAGDDR